jgi:hypothetical protein
VLEHASSPSRKCVEAIKWARGTERVGSPPLTLLPKTVPFESKNLSPGRNLEIIEPQLPWKNENSDV